jgi:hypothetical protein
MKRRRERNAMNKPKLSAGRYGRAFNWTMARNDKPVQSISEAITALSANDHLEIFEDFLAISRNRQHNVLALSKLQLHLVEELLMAQSAIKHYRTKYEEAQDRLKTASSAARVEVEEELNFIDHEKFFHSAYANCLRGIGDGIAWRALGYDRIALRALAGNAVKQQVLDEGFVGELRHFAAAVDRKRGLPIINSVTNWLAIGDVTLIREDGTVEITEVKNSDAPGSRINRQRQRMTDATDFLNNGSGKLEGETVTAIHLFGTRIKNDLQSLEQLLEEAGKLGWVGRHFNDYCFVEAFDARVSAARDNWAKGRETVAQILKTAENRGETGMSLDSSEVVAFTPNCAPLAVFPFSNKMCVELLTGAKMYRCHINFTALGREFTKTGWTIRKTPEDHRREFEATKQHAPGLFQLSKKGRLAHVSPADIMRIAMETANPSYVVETLDTILDSHLDAETNYVFAYGNEKSLWR